MSTPRLLATAALWGLAGLVLVPVLLFGSILALSHAFDPHCGTPAGSDGCASGADAIALAAAMPAFALFFLVGTIHGLRKRQRSTREAFDAALSGKDASGRE